MDKIKELTDFYIWMQENGYDHNIRARVEKKAEIYLNGINVGQKLPIHNVSNFGGAIPYDILSDSLKKSIDSIEDNLNR